MDKLIQFLETYNGRDKILRLFCYLSKFLAGSLQSSQLALQFDQFSHQLSTSRACFRLLDDVPTMVDILKSRRKKDKENLMSWIINLTKNIVDLAFCSIDHISWAVDHKIIASSSEIWDIASTFCWIISLYLSLYLNVVQMVLIAKQKLLLKANVYKREVISNLSAQQMNLTLSALKCIIDLIFAINYLPSGLLWAKLFNKWQVGALGVISSLVGLHRALLLF